MSYDLKNKKLVKLYKREKLNFKKEITMKNSLTKSISSKEELGALRHERNFLDLRELLGAFKPQKFILPKQ